MENIIKLGTSSLVHADSLQYMKKLNFSQFDLIFVDPPLTWSPDKVINWIDQAVRLIKNGGNIVVFNFASFMLDLDHLIQEKMNDNTKYNLYKNLYRTDAIFIQNNKSNPRLYGLPQQTLSLCVYCKNPQDRKFYAKSLTPGKISIEEKTQTLTDMWIQKRHSSKSIKEYIIENMLYCYTREGDKVLDCFGRKGTVPYLCNQYNIKCVSIEENEFNIFVMEDKCKIKLKERNKTFVGYLRSLMSKVSDTSNKERKNAIVNNLNIIKTKNMQDKENQKFIK
jgi:DNA modification methylase